MTAVPPPATPDENDHLAFAASMISKTNVDRIVANVQVAGPDAVNKTLTLAMMEVQSHAMIAIAERLDRVAGALEPRDTVEVVSDFDRATQDKINRTLDTMREVAGRGAVPFTHTLADAFDLEVDGRVVGTHTGDPAMINPVTDRAHGGCPECYALEPFASDHVAGCVVGTIIARLRDVRDLTARMHAGAVTGGSPEWRSGYNRGVAIGRNLGRADANLEIAVHVRKLDAIAKLCADREVEDVAGGPCDAREIWPSEIRTILRGEENPT